MKHVPCLGESQILLPSVDRIPRPLPLLRRSLLLRLLLPHHCYCDCFFLHLSIGSRQDPVQSCQDPAPKHAPRLGETQILFPSVDRIPPRSRPILSGSCHETCTLPRRNAHFTSIRRSDPTRIPSNPVRILPRNVHPASAKRTFYFHPSIGSHQDPVQSRQDPATKRAPRLSETHISSSCVEDDPVGSCIRSRRFCRKTQRKIDFTSLSLTLIYITK